MKTVNIVMRSCNDIEFVDRTITSILKQSFNDFEIINFDNQSTDGTIDIIKKYPSIKSVNVPAGTYKPGVVLNRAVKMCDCKIIVFNNADAIPLDENWLENLIKPILQGDADAVYARQVPRPNANPWVLEDYERSFGDTRFSPDFFSLASSAVKSDVFSKSAFDESVQYSEDVYFVKKLCENGGKIAYAPDAQAEHSHNYTAAQWNRRIEGEGRADAVIYSSAQSFFSMIKGIAGGIARDAAFLRRTGKSSQFFKCAKMRIMQKWHYYKSRRDAFKESGEKSR